MYIGDTENSVSPFVLSNKEKFHMKIIMLGAPGAGKGTQAKQINDKIFDTTYFYRGYIPCKHKNGTDLGKKAKEYMDQGALVPDELTCDLVMDRIKAG